MVVGALAGILASTQMNSLGFNSEPNKIQPIQPIAQQPETKPLAFQSRLEAQNKLKLRDSS